MCRTQKLGFYAEGQGHNHVKGRIVLKVVFPLTAEANLMRLQREIKDNEKVCGAHDLGFYPQGQGRSQV